MHMADTRLLFISSQSTTRDRKILNIMWRVKLTVTAAWMKTKVDGVTRINDHEFEFHKCTLFQNRLFLRLDLHRQFIMMLRIEGLLQVHKRT